MKCVQCIYSQSPWKLLTYHHRYEAHVEKDNAVSGQKFQTKFNQIDQRSVFDTKPIK